MRGEEEDWAFTAFDISALRLFFPEGLFLFIGYEGLLLRAFKMTELHFAFMRHVVFSFIEHIEPYSVQTVFIMCICVASRIFGGKIVLAVYYDSDLSSRSEARKLI